MGSVTAEPPAMPMASEALSHGRAFSSVSGASFPTDLPDDEHREVDVAARWRAVLLVAACFVVGIFLVSAGMRHWGHPTSAAASADELIQQIQAAEASNHWGSTTETNDPQSVLGLIQQAETAYPGDPRLASLRKFLSADAMTLAARDRQQGLSSEASRLAAVALALNPANQTAYAMVHQADVQPIPTSSVALGEPLTQLVPLTPSSAPVPLPTGSAPATAPSAASAPHSTPSHAPTATHTSGTPATKPPISVPPEPTTHPTKPAGGKPWM